MKELLQVYKQTRAMPISALYLCIWLRLTCQAGLLNEAQVVQALGGAADKLGELLTAAQGDMSAADISGVIRMLEKEIAG